MSIKIITVLLLSQFFTISICSSSSSLSYREDDSLVTTIVEQDNQNVKLTGNAVKITNNLENQPVEKKLKSPRRGKKIYRQSSLPIISINNLDSYDSTQDSNKSTEDSNKLTEKSIDSGKSLSELDDWAEEDDQPIRGNNSDTLEDSIKRKEKKKRRFCTIF